jgi:hypothetical protein
MFSVKFAMEDYSLQCYSQLEMDDWINKIKEVQELALTSKDTIKELSKVL